MADDLFQQLDNDPIPLAEVKFDDLVGDGKKYKTTDDVAKAIAHKDAFIEQLKREAAEARQAVKERMNMEQFLDKLERTRMPNVPSEPETTSAEQDGNGTAVTLETIEQLFEKREQAKTRQTNLDAVENRLKSTFGDDWKRRVQEKAVALKTSTAWLTDIAARNPDAFFELLGVNQQQQTEPTFTPPPATRISPSTQPSTKGYEHFKKLRQEKGEGWYFSIPVQQEIWRELQAQGEEVFYKK